MKPAPLNPVFHEKIWGASHLEPWFRDTPELTGEVWFATPEVLVKFLFTTGDLSVQVHPPDEYARVHESSAGKTEMWHILSAEAGAQIALGLARPVTREKLERAALDGSIMELLRWVPVRAGDTFYIPAGVIHAIGAGISLCEIQQNSDVTYRLFDYGRGRELHIDRSLDVAFLDWEHPGAATPEPLGPGRELLVESPYFRTERLMFGGEFRVNSAAAVGGELLIVIAGKGAIEEQEYSQGQVWKIDPAAEVLVRSQGPSTFLRCLYPALKN